MDWQWNRPGLACSYWQQYIVTMMGCPLIYDGGGGGEMRGLEVRLESLHLMVGFHMGLQCDKLKDAQ